MVRCKALLILFSISKLHSFNSIMDSTDALNSRGERADVNLSNSRGGQLITQSEFFSDSYYMNYSRKGIAVIINNIDFNPATNFKKRFGSRWDEDSMYILLDNMGFDQVIIKQNRTSSQMEQDLKEVSSRNLSTYSCFVCVILSYGKDGTVYGTDKNISLEVLMKPFKGDSCNDLAGKPKIFFIQACSPFDYAETADSNPGEEEIEEEMEEEITVRIPTEADFFVFHSEIPGYLGWESQKRKSWFIQSICEVITAKRQTTDLATMMTCVTRKVDQLMENSPNQGARKFHVPCITSMLTRNVYFK